ncbi:Rab6-interacting golgin like [Thalictrum thalictroides]|uniref:RAB6-interacting golgin n=1 Tax=Thalictrum thalictroides TaxID=46969 RepID=A0A7J6VQ63_THATH|nr:Rab6-interacting golgin like [Thalictrum thalictroides]
MQVRSKLIRGFVEAKMHTQNKTLEQQQSQIQTIKSLGDTDYSGSLALVEDKDEEISRSALIMFRAKEEEIEKINMVVRERVHAQLGHVEEETKCLEEI